MSSATPQDDARTRRLTARVGLVVLAGALALLVARAGAPGWGDAADAAVAAYRVEAGGPPGAPGAVMVGKLATLVPVGDLGFRVAAVAALAAVIALAGIIALGRALVADEPLAATVGAGVAATAPVVTAAGAQAG
ncbi:MAG: DUF2723 domain-containing protein, partial [Kofleriaceae bacterium]|nr:DUF2723 domain-containing protein [Kofleriaceae bacterium]